MLEFISIYDNKENSVFDTELNITIRFSKPSELSTKNCSNDIFDSLELNLDKFSRFDCYSDIKDISEINITDYIRYKIITQFFILRNYSYVKDNIKIIDYLLFNLQSKLNTQEYYNFLDGIVDCFKNS